MDSQHQWGFWDTLEPGWESGRQRASPDRRPTQHRERNVTVEGGADTIEPGGAVDRGRARV
jgi:hypothetical protein